MPGVAFEFIAKHPVSLLIAGGILLLLISSVENAFAVWGWTLIILGVILQVMWLIFFRRI
jgi:hypothetical protein